nr:cell division protein [Cryptomonas paramecium]
MVKLIEEVEFWRIIITNLQSFVFFLISNHVIQGQN